MRIHVGAGLLTSAAVLFVAGVVSAQQAPPTQYVFPVRIDLETGVMHAPTPRHSGRRSAFTIIERSEAKIVMQGYENGRAFSAVLDEPGTLAIRAAVDGTTASIFALCTDLRFVTQSVDEGMERKED
jgi:hypothetical protein